MDNYIDKFERVVDLLRTVGNYSSAALTDSLYVITSESDVNFAVNDYLLLNSTTKARVTVLSTARIFTVDTQGTAIADFGTWKTLAPYADYGNRKTLNIKLLEKNGYEFKYQKYPLIALRLPVAIKTVDGVSSFDANILIATFTSKTRKEQERIANTFRPILWPLAARFIDMCKRSGEFLMLDQDWEQIDRMFYGTGGEDENIANVFSDPLDAVEIRGLKLNFIVENCADSGYTPT